MRKGVIVAVLALAGATAGVCAILARSPYASLPPEERKLAELTDQLAGTGPMRWNEHGAPETGSSWTVRSYEYRSRANAARALGTLSQPQAAKAVPLLVAALAVPDLNTGDGGISIRWCALQGLGELAPIDASAKAALDRLSSDKDPKLAQQARDALEIGAITAQARERERAGQH